MPDIKHIKNTLLLQQYLFEILDVQVSINLLDKGELKKLPFYLRQGYQFSTGKEFINQQDILFVWPLGEEIPKISQLKNNLTKIAGLLNREAVLIIDSVPSYIRNRLIKQKIDFIVPGKQLFMPNFLIQLEEKKQSSGNPGKNLLPSAQLIFLYYLLSKNNRIEEYSFSDLSKKFNYSAMGISNAIKNLEVNNLCEVIGNKEKHIIFTSSRTELWEMATNILINPIRETWYIENITDTYGLLQSNITALAEYADINPEIIKYYALDRKSFLNMKKNNMLNGLNEYEGEYCLEIWKYNPELLIESQEDSERVDPLSLYLSLKNSNDERIRIALDQLKIKYLW